MSDTLKTDDAGPKLTTDRIEPLEIKFLPRSYNRNGTGECYRIVLQNKTVRS